jgi:hypothetical protein
MSGRGRYVAVLVGGVLAIAAPTALSLALDRPAAAPRSAEAVPSAAPAASGACATDAAQDCERRAKDFATRARLSESDRAAARARLADARAAIDSAKCTEEGCQRGEVQPRGGPAPNPVQLELARRALVDAGFDDVTVRQARPDDPAPAGTVIYAAAVGPACIVLVSNGSEQILGKLPDGHCLAA